MQVNIDFKKIKRIYMTNTIPRKPCIHIEFEDWTFVTAVTPMFFSRVFNLMQKGN